MKRIPITAAKEIADKYGYDQVIIYARKVGESPDPHGEHMTSYGVNKANCDAAGKVAKAVQKIIWSHGFTQDKVDSVCIKLYESNKAKWLEGLNDIQSIDWFVDEAVKATNEAHRVYIRGFFYGLWK